MTKAIDVRHSDAAINRLRTASGVRRCWMPCSATSTMASPTPESNAMTRIGAKQGDTAMAAVVTAISAVPRNSALGSRSSFRYRPANEPTTDPAPQNVINRPYPMEPAWKCSTSGTSATITRPNPNTSPVQASTNVRSTRSRAMNTNPARSPWCSVASERSPSNGARTVHTRIAETANVIAFRPNTHVGPMAATSAPPIAGPTMMPAFRPSEMRLFAHDSSDGSTMFGMAAADAIQNGVSTTAETNAKASSQPGSPANAIAAKAATPATSDTIITRRRSNRSPIAPAIGARKPLTPNVRTSVAESHAGERVCSYTVNISAV